MENKTSILIMLLIFLLLPMQAYARGNAIGNFMDSVGYAVDSIVDSVRLFFTFDSKAKADLNLEIASKKIDQISVLSKKGNVNLAETVKSDYEKTMNEIKNAVIKDETIKSELAEDVIEHKAKASSAKISIEAQSGSNAPMEKINEKASELSSLVKAGNEVLINKNKVNDLLEGLKKDLSEFVSQIQQNQSQFQFVAEQYLQYMGMLLTQASAHGSIADTAFNQGNYLDSYEETLIARNLFSEVKLLIKQAKEKEKELATKPVILVQPSNIYYTFEMKSEIDITNIGGKPLLIKDIECDICIINFTKNIELNTNENIIIPIKFTKKIDTGWLKISSNDRDVRIPVAFARLEGEIDLPFDKSDYDAHVKYWAQFPNLKFECRDSSGEKVKTIREAVWCIVRDEEEEIVIYNARPRQKVEKSIEYYDISKLPYDASDYDEAVAYWSQFPNVTFECRNARGEFINKIEGLVLCSVWSWNQTISYEVREGDIKEQKLIKECTGNNKFTATFYDAEDGIRVTFDYMSGSTTVTSSGIGLVSISNGWYSPSFEDKITLLPGGSKELLFSDYDKYTPIRDFNFLAVCGNPDSIFAYDRVNIIVKCPFTGNFAETASCSANIHKVTPTSEIPSTPSSTEATAGSAHPNKTAEDVSEIFPMPSASGTTAGSGGRTKSDEQVMREKEQEKELVAKSNCISASFNAVFEKYNERLPWGEIVNALNVTLYYASGKLDLANTYMMLHYGTTTQPGITADKNFVFKPGDSQAFQFSRFNEPFYTKFYGVCDHNFEISVTCEPSAEKSGGGENCLSEVRVK